MFNFEELLSIPNILTIQLSSIKTDLQKKFDVEGSLQKQGFLSLLGVSRHGRVPYRDSLGNRVLVHLTVLLYRLDVGLTLN